MISRRLIRIKVLQSLYSFQKTEDASLVKSEKELFFSLKKAYDLYHYILLLLIDLSKYAESRIDLAKQKKVPTYNDLNPNTRFIDNSVIRLLSENDALAKYLNENKLSWVQEPELIKNLFLAIAETDSYKAYMAKDEVDFNDDKELIMNIIEEQIAQSDELYQVLEEKSIFWNDDLDFMLTMVVKTLQRFKAKQSQYMQLMPQFKNDEDVEFAKHLYRKTIVNKSELAELIHQFTTNWELERIAFMDILIMSQAITEVLHFQSIPVRVSLNEYIEISKYYSTEKSSQFINGVLDKIVTHLKKEKKFTKMGRGLMGEV
jgi:transcription antitermination protein NusB